VRVKTGDRLRTGPDATARRLPMGERHGRAGSVMGSRPGSCWRQPSEGRIEQRSEGSDIIRLETAEGLVRGRGRVVVRRQSSQTLVTVVEGRFRVEAGGKSLALSGGQGCRLSGRRQRSRMVETLPLPPKRLTPGSDPVYVNKDNPLSLAWDGSAPSFHVQILPVGSEEILLARDVSSSPLRVQIPWLGTYRWRVSARDARGLEGLPSAEGLVCIYEK
jgi:hypothetical protein